MRLLLYKGGGPRGRKKGSSNKHHKWLARFLIASSKGLRWHYVYPDDEDIAEWNPKTGLKLKPGRTITRILNEKMFGTYEVTADGKPKVRAGLFMTYKPAIKRVARGEEGATIGRYFFRKVPRQPGYAKLELGHGVERHFTVNKKVRELKFESDADIEAAQKIQPGAGIKEGKLRPLGEPPAGEYTDTPPVGATGGITHVPEPTERTKRVLSTPAVRENDPPAWVLDKFRGESEYQEERVERPTTLRVTLGLYSNKNKKQQAGLAQEWGGIVWTLARRASDASKITDNYERFYADDVATGRTPGVSEASATRKYMQQVNRDLVQEGYRALFEAARTYQPSQQANDRFDRYAYAQVRAAILEHSRKTAIIEGADPDAIVADSMIEEAARKQGPQWFLPPDEHAELNQVAGPAKRTLLLVLNEPTFPEVYRRAFMARMWMDAPESARTEHENIEARRKKGNPAAKTWMRPWTGASGVGSVLGDHVVDPKTGRTIVLSELDPRTQRKLMQEFFQGARENIKARLLPDEDKLIARWLALESKLAGANRRLFTGAAKQRVRAMLPTERPRAGGRTKRLVIVPPKGSTATGHPGVGFFSEAKNLAQKLGINLRAIDPQGRGGVYQTPGVSLGTHAQTHLDLAEHYHTVALEAGKLDNRKLGTRLRQARLLSRKLQALGHFVHKDGRTDWHEPAKGVGVTALHAAATDFLRHKTAIQKKVAAGRARGKETGGRAANLNAYRVTTDEKKAYEAARATLETAMTAVGKQHPQIVADVVQTLQRGQTPGAEMLSAHRHQLQSAQREATNIVAVLEHERERRKRSAKVAKAFPALRLTDALWKGKHDLSAMIALEIPEALGRKLRIPGGEAVSDLHITLVYLGKLYDLPARDVLGEAAARAAARVGPLRGRVNGVGRFKASETSDGKDVIYAVPDVPFLDDLRAALIAELEAVGVTPPRDHGFTPHITLAYVDGNKPTPKVKAMGDDLRFDSLLVKVGPMRRRVELNDDITNKSTEVAA